MADADDAAVGRLVNDLTVSYTVRELLSRIEERLVRMETRAESVATQADVDAIAAKSAAAIAALADKVDNNIAAVADKVDKLESVRDRMIGAAFAVGALAGGGAGWLANLLSS
jgi:ParB-like chromosome segregation protein Spo0J